MATADQSEDVIVERLEGRVHVTDGAGLDAITEFEGRQRQLTRVDEPTLSEAVESSGHLLARARGGRRCGRPAAFASIRSLIMPISIVSSPARRGSGLGRDTNEF